MKKHFLFGLMAVLLAGIGFGGVSLADCTTSAELTDEHVASIGSTYYCSLREAVAAAGDGDEINLLKNDETSFAGEDLKIIIDDVNLTINGHNKTLFGSGSVYGVGGTTTMGHGILVKGSKNVTINDLVIDRFGNESNRIAQNIHPLVVSSLYTAKLTLSGVTIQNFHREAMNIGGGEFEFNNVTIQGTHYTSSYGTDELPHPFQQGIELWNGAHGTMNNVNINGIENDPDGTANAFAVIVNDGAVVINDSVVSSTDGGVLLNAGGTITLNGENNFNAGSGVLICGGAGIITVNNGTYEGTLEKESGTLTIQGGKFSVDPTTYVVGGYEAFENAGEYDVLPAGTVAMIGDTTYTSLRGALAAAAANDVITLLDNDEVSFGDSKLMLTIGTGITIEGNGKYIKGVSSGYDGWHVTVIRGDNNITIRDLTFKNFGDDLGHDTNGTTTPIYVHSTYGGKLTLENVNIESYNSRGIVIGNGSFEIKGGQIKGSSNQAYQQAIESYVSANSSISGLVITGVKDLIDGDDVTDAYGIMHAGNGTVTVTNTKIGGSRCVAVSSPTSAWASALSYDKSNGKLILGEGNEFEGSTSVIAVVPMGDPVEQSSSSTIEVNDGKYDGAIEKSTDASVSEAKIEISGGKFSVDPSTYLVAGKIAQSINEGNLKFEVVNRPSSGGSSSSGGGSSSNKTGSTNTGTNNTGDNNTGAVDTGALADTGTDNDEIENTIENPQELQENGYTNEMNAAYEFAYANGITTMKSIDDAEMFEGLTRIAMAKMLSQYAINVLGKTPADVEVPEFKDVPAELNEQYNNGVTLAYKLGIMGINMPNNEFRPYDFVTRAQFGTALSRLLFGIEDGEEAYYSTHLAKLKAEGIITNDDPTLEELRGYVMLMIMRSAK